MNGPKVEAFFREFPFLAKYVGRDELREAYVSRVDEGLLRKRVGDFSSFGSKYFTSILFLDEKEEELAMVGDVMEERRFLWWTFTLWVSQTVEEALLSLKKFGEKRDAYYVLGILESDCDHGKWAAIYKSPKGFTVSSWIEELVGRESAVIRKKVKNIDAEATLKT